MQCWGTEDEDDGDPPRLWAPNAMFPGTAFTRSLGDTGAAGVPLCGNIHPRPYAGVGMQHTALHVLAAVAEDIGVIADPEVASVDISGETPFVVLASDGVFEFMRDQVVVELVSPVHASRERPPYPAWVHQASRSCTGDCCVRRVVVYVAGGQI